MPSGAHGGPIHVSAGAAPVIDASGWLDAVERAAVEHVRRTPARRPPVAVTLELPVVHRPRVAPEVRVVAVGIVPDRRREDVPRLGRALSQDDVLVRRHPIGREGRPPRQAVDRVAHSSTVGDMASD